MVRLSYPSVTKDTCNAGLPLLRGHENELWALLNSMEGISALLISINSITSKGNFLFEK